jgi:hypothetical protein
MKIKKALKRLGQVEGLLSDIVDHYSGIEQSSRDLLVSAQLLVVRAKESLSVPSSSSTGEIVEKGKSDLPPTAKGKKPPISAKKRPASKRKGVRRLAADD